MPTVFITGVPSLSATVQSVPSLAESYSSDAVSLTCTGQNLTFISDVILALTAASLALAPQDLGIDYNSTDSLPVTAAAITADPWWVNLRVENTVDIVNLTATPQDFTFATSATDASLVLTEAALTLVGQDATLTIGDLTLGLTTAGLTAVPQGFSFADPTITTLLLTEASATCVPQAVTSTATYGVGGISLTATGQDLVVYPDAPGAGTNLPLSEASLTLVGQEFDWEELKQLEDLSLTCIPQICNLTANAAPPPDITLELAQAGLTGAPQSLGFIFYGTLSVTEATLTASPQDFTLGSAQLAAPVGVSATTVLGSVVVVADQNPVVVADGFYAASSIGDESVSIVLPLNTIAMLTGVYATGHLGSTSICGTWDVVNDAQSPGWVPVNDNQCGA